MLRKEYGQTNMFMSIVRYDKNNAGHVNTGTFPQ